MHLKFFILFFLVLSIYAESKPDKFVSKEPLKKEDRSWFLSYNLGSKLANYSNLFYTFRAENKINQFGFQIGFTGYGYQLYGEENVVNLFVHGKLAPRYQVGFSTIDLGITYHLSKSQNWSPVIYSGIGSGFMSAGAFAHKLYMGGEIRYYMDGFYISIGSELRYLKIYNQSMDASIVEVPGFISIGIKL